MLIFGTSISAIEICDYFLQDLCRILILLDAKPKAKDLDETEILIPDNKTVSELIRFSSSFLKIN